MNYDNIIGGVLKQVTGAQNGGGFPSICVRPLDSEMILYMSEIEVGYSDKLGYPTVPKKMITISRIVIIDEQK